MKTRKGKSKNDQLRLKREQAATSVALDIINLERKGSKEHSDRIYDLTCKFYRLLEKPKPVQRGKKYFKNKGKFSKNKPHKGEPKYGKRFNKGFKKAQSKV